MPLKNADIARALNAGLPSKLSDGHSLYLITSGRGAGSWVYEYRDAGKLRSKGLGSVAESSVAAARRAREDFRAQRRNCVSTGQLAVMAAPSIQPHQAPANGTHAPFGEAALAYILAHSDEWADGGERHRATLKNHCGKIARLPVALISLEMVADVLKPIWRGPTSGVGFRLRAFMQHVFAAAGIDPNHNPAAWSRLKEKLSKKAPEVQARAALPFEDAPALMAELAACTGTAGQVARVVQFVMLTAARAQEVAGMDWRECI